MGGLGISGRGQLCLLGGPGEVDGVGARALLVPAAGLARSPPGFLPALLLGFGSAGEGKKAGGLRDEVAPRGLGFLLTAQPL